MLAVAKAVWRRVNFSHAFRDCRNGFVHDDIFGWFDDFELGDAPIFLDSNFDESRDFVAGRNAGGRLNPSAVKAIMKHMAIPAELRCAASTAGHGGLETAAPCLSAFLIFL